MATTPDKWFRGADGRNAAEVRYLDALRNAASTASWKLAGADTDSAHVGIPLYVSVEVPALKPFRDGRCAPSLEAQLWPADSIYGLRLEGCWGDSRYPMDSVTTVESGELDVRGVEVSPEQLAAWTVAWLVRQLARPLLLRRWPSGALSVVLGDTGDEVARSGGFLKRRGMTLEERSLTDQCGHSRRTSALNAA